jgi:hypothetical protein
MSRFIPMLAASLPIDLPNKKVTSMFASDLILVIGLAALLFGGLISWIVFVRGPRKHPSENRSLPKPHTPSVTITEDGRERHRKKRRARRRDHRSRNPTLSQTGGLPPPRDPEETPII